MMDPSRRQSVQQVVQDALDQTVSAFAGETWLRGTCVGDQEMLHQALTLIRAAHSTKGFLGRMPASGLPEVSPGDGDASLVGRSLAHYSIVRRVGMGGMGHVYLAHDVALGRETAIKVLPPHLPSELRRWFVREIEATGKLQHPAIATFYEAGEADGHGFIALEFVHGETLRHRLQRGAIPVDDALAIARCLLQALHHAHAARVLHCDIKPENVIVTGTRAAKLLDFGIARLMNQVMTEEGRTQDDAPGGQLIGTLGYMAPEQVLGNPLDERTDLFQIGAVLFEMLTGQPAFPGNSALGRLAAVLYDTPDFALAVRQSGSTRVREILSRALGHDPTHRYESAAAFARDLDDATRGELTTELPIVIVVADFVSETGDTRVDWLATAMAEGLRQDLRSLGRVTVLPSDALSESLQTTAGGEPPSLAAAALRLGCTWAVGGRIDCNGSTFYVTTELQEIAVARSLQLPYITEGLPDLHALRNAVSTQIAHVLGVSIAAARRGTSIPAAEEHYARACLLRNSGSKHSLEEALVLLHRALEIDPTYADALAAIASICGLRAIATSDPEEIRKALDFADRALTIDPLHAQAHLWRGYALARQGRLADGTAEYRRSIELDPSGSDAHYFLGAGLVFQGEHRDAVPLLQRTVQLAPVNGFAWLALGAAHVQLSQFEAALYSFGRAVKLESMPSTRYPTAGAAAYIAEVLRLQGRLQEARSEALRSLDAAERSDHSYRDTFRGYGLLVLGRIALDQRDIGAACAAFQQLQAQLDGRPKTRSCGHLAVQLLAGLARARHDTNPYEQARDLLGSREKYNFEPFFGLTHALSEGELARTANSLAIPAGPLQR